MRYSKSLATTALLLTVASAAWVAPAVSGGPSAAVPTTVTTGPIDGPTPVDHSGSPGEPATGRAAPPPSDTSPAADPSVIGERDAAASAAVGNPTGATGATGPTEPTVPGRDPSNGSSPIAVTAGGDHPAVSDLQASYRGEGGERPLAELSLDGDVPADFRIQPPAPQAATTDGHGGPSAYSASDGCLSQCINRATAHARGFGALLVLESDLQAQWYVTVSGDDFFETKIPQGSSTSLTWGIDHLEPGQTYDVMAMATDSFDNTSFAWGSFTTLSQRDVSYSFGDLGTSGGPGNIESTTRHLRFDGSPLVDVTPGQAGIQWRKDVDRHIDLELWVLRQWDSDLCQFFTITDDTPSYGYSNDSCLTWNAVEVVDLDLDRKPSGSSYWTSTTVSTLFETPFFHGSPPEGYGSHYFDFVVPMSITVTYS